MVMKRKRGIIAQAAPEEVLDEAPADENTSPPVSDPAQERAARFAITSQDQAPEAWPGPFATARELHRLRPAAQAEREVKLNTKDGTSSTCSTIEWTPHRMIGQQQQQQQLVRTDRHVIPSLESLVLNYLADHIDAVPALTCVSRGCRSKLAKLVSARRQLTQLSLFTMGQSHVDLCDCSQVEERDLVQALARTKGLEELVLGFCGRSLSDKSLSGLDLTALRRLDLGGCYRLSNVGIGHLVSQVAPTLEHFGLGSNQRISREAVETICSNLPQLKSVVLNESPQLMDRDLACLEVVGARLEHLDLAHMPQLTSRFFRDLAPQWRALRVLNLSQCTQLSDEACRDILAHVVVLERLELADVVQLTDVAFRGLKALPLAHVNVRGCYRVSDIGIGHIAESAGLSLRNLDCSSLAHLTNQSLIHLMKHCSEMRILNVSFCRLLTDNGLGKLTDECPKLESLTMWGNTQITPKFLQGHHLPDQLVIRGHPLLTGLSLRY